MLSVGGMLSGVSGGVEAAVERAKWVFAKHCGVNGIHDGSSFDILVQGIRWR